ncbi:hypothetical protein JKF63_02462 [Porcisia hertigi]|uniref:Uncharacterized protein n=1 Tax=Porcisia hertigi TaxID=2761500 RepID=A0A836L2E7_9TRYP|nr:hypothetical protein JKF63_02462 [Porcisia hertigi]
MSTSSSSDKQQHFVEHFAIQKNDDHTTPQRFHPSLRRSSQLPEQGPALPPPLLVIQEQGPPPTTLAPSGVGLGGSDQHAAVSVSQAVGRSDSNVNVTTVSQQQGTRVRAAGSSSTLTDVEVRQSNRSPDNSTFSGAPPPMATSQRSSSAQVSSGEPPAEEKATCSSVHTSSSSHLTSSTLLTRKLPPLPPLPPSGSGVLPFPALPLPQAAPLADERPRKPSSLKAPSHLSVVAAVRSTDTAASTDPEHPSYAMTPLLQSTSERPLTVSASAQLPPTAGATTAAQVGTTAPMSVVTTEPSPVIAGQPQHFRRQRSVFEAAVCDLFSTRNAPHNDPRGDDSSSVFSSRGDSERSSAEQDSARVGRTRGVAGINQAEGNRRRRSSGVGVNAAGRQSPSGKRRGLKSARGTSRRTQRSTVVRLYEAEGRSGPSSSPRSGDMSMTLQNTNVPRANNNATQRRGAPPGIGIQGGGNAVVANVADGDGTARGALASGVASPCVQDGSAVLLLFTSPAAGLQMKCQTSTKNKGLTKADACWLTHRSFFGKGVTDQRHEGDKGNGKANTGYSGGDTESSALARRPTVSYRVTGAFENEHQPAETWPLGGSDAGGDQGALGVRSTSFSPFAAGCALDGCGAVLALTIRGMSPLHADAGVVHPFVRVWVVSCASGRSLLQASAAVPCAVTHPFDLRAHKTRAPWWNAHLALRLSPENMRAAAKDAMLLFEVLDFGNESLHGFPLFREGLYPICWGFLMLHDWAGRSNLFAADDLHVQLYRYPCRTPWYLSWLSTLLPVSWSSRGSVLNPRDVAAACGYDHGSCDDRRASMEKFVPTIYSFFANANNRKIPYEGGLVLSIRETSDTDFVPETTEMLAYEEYLLSTLVAGGGSSAVPRSTRSVGAPADGGMELRQQAANGSFCDAAVPPSPWSALAPTENYYRMDGERALLPREILQTTAVPGAVTCVSFAHSGCLVALGVCRHLQHMVELRDPLLPGVPAVATLVGHTGHIHRVAFQKEDRYLLSCSSDGTVSVWQSRAFGGVFKAGLCSETQSVEFVCTLPHGFPVYVAVFHQDKIITGGFGDQLLVWSYEPTPQDEMDSGGTCEGTTLRLTSTFTPELDRTARHVDSVPSTLEGIGELVQRVDAVGAATARKGEATITLSLASNERSTRLWSVHANGSVVCWRATGDTAICGNGRGQWEMSVRHTAECDGATEVQVKGAYAVVTCGSAPFVFVFDASTCERLRVVNTRLPFCTPIHLLPDGEAFVAAVGDPGRLLAWECSDGGLCTQDTGYGKASPQFIIARMAWAESQQLAVFVSRSSCTDGEMVRYTQGPMTATAGQSSVASYYRQQEQQYRLKDMPAEMTLITVTGTVRSKSTVIIATEPHSSEAFVKMCDGDVHPKRRAAYLAKRTQAVHQRAAERDSRNARLYPSVASCEPLPVIAMSAATTIPYEVTEKGSRINSILNFWRGLVTQHRHAKAHPNLVEEDSTRGDASDRQPPTWGPAQYMDNRDEV